MSHILPASYQGSYIEGWAIWALWGPSGCLKRVAKIHSLQTSCAFNSVMGNYFQPKTRIPSQTSFQSGCMRVLGAARGKNGQGQRQKYEQKQMWLLTIFSSLHFSHANSEPSLSKQTSYLFTIEGPIPARQKLSRMLWNKAGEKCGPGGQIGRLEWPHLVPGITQQPQLLQLESIRLSICLGPSLPSQVKRNKQGRELLRLYSSC